MSQSKQATAFPECRELFEYAVRNSGIRLGKLTYEEAFSLRHRCYAYRRAVDRYPNIMIQVRPNERTDGYHELLFTVRPSGLPSEFLSNLTTLDGMPADPPDVFEDDLASAAAYVRRGLGLESE